MRNPGIAVASWTAKFARGTLCLSRFKAREESKSSFGRVAGRSIHFKNSCPRLTVHNWATPSNPQENNIRPYGSDHASEVNDHHSAVEEPGPLIINMSRIRDISDFRTPNGLVATRRIDEIFQYLNASLKIRALDRAEKIIQRLAKFYPPWSAELLEAHNLYLRASVEEILRTQSLSRTQRLQQWFEKEMKSKGVQPNETSLVLMCRACIAVLSGPSCNRTLRRYLAIAEEKPKILLELVNSGELNYTEWQKLNTLIDHHSTSTRDSAESLDDAASPSENLLESQPEVTAPGIKPVDQKGSGLQSLQKNIVTLEDISSLSSEYVESSSSRLLEFQKVLEQSSIDAGFERWREENAKMLQMGINPLLKTPKIERLLWTWYSEMLHSVQKELEMARKSAFAAKPGSDNLKAYAPFIILLPAEKLTSLTISFIIHEIVCQGITRPFKLTTIASKLGNLIAGFSEGQQALELESASLRASRKSMGTQAQTALKKLSKRSQRFKEMKLSPTSNLTSREARYLLSRRHEWPVIVMTMVGASLLSKLVEVARVNVKEFDSSQTTSPGSDFVPAFVHKKTRIRGKIFGFLEASPVLQEILVREPPKINMGARLPMLIEPREWQGDKNGGYYVHPSSLVRNKFFDDTRKLYIMAAAERGDLSQLFKGLNVLGKTPWKINKDVLKVMIEAWNSGQAIGNLPPLNFQPTLPTEPGPDEDAKAKVEHYMKMKQVENEISGYHSNRCFLNLLLEVARAYRDLTFYFPHNIDFRGRAYPMPTYLNHLGSDSARGLLMFGHAKKLGSVGLFWLKVQLSNIYGQNKTSLKDREAFAMDHLEEIFDSANNPLGGGRWWLSAEDPWQCLATCIELRNALSLPEPSEYQSSLPVHQDGTCNGMQHYAALGGDAYGASQVNLEPNNRPMDIYTGIADLVSKEVAADAESGNEMGLQLQGKITRKVVKQTVMTNVYGVTFVGARAQVQRQLDELIPNQVENKISNYNLSLYVTRKIFGALSTIFQGAQLIQNWLAECAARISSAITADQIREMAMILGEKVPRDKKDGANLEKSRMKMGPGAKVAEKFVKSQLRSCLIWTTPLKLPVVQPYRKASIRAFKTPMQQITISQPQVTDSVCKRKQVQGFAPNFIHSLDAAHMIFTATRCADEKLCFASVHDSFWTHAADVPVMNKIIREEFVRLHSGNILENLAEEFRVRYRGAMYLRKFYPSHQIRRKIMALRKGRARTPAGGLKKSSFVMELVEEAKRQDLLNSADSGEREMGARMVTPGKIYEQEVGQECGVVMGGDAESPDGGFGMGMAFDPEHAEEEVEQILEEGDGGGGLEDEVSYDSVPGFEEDLGIAPGPEAPVGGSSVLQGRDGCGETSSRPAARSRSPPPSPSPSPGSGSRPQPGPMQVWLPLEIPPIPPRGSYDVSRVLKSDYFFS